MAKLWALLLLLRFTALIHKGRNSYRDFQLEAIKISELIQVHNPSDIYLGDPWESVSPKVRAVL